MNPFNFLKRLAKGSRQEQKTLLTQASEHQDASAEQDGLDFIAAINTHAKWKVRLKDAITNNTLETIDLDLLGRDDCCALGNWIYSKGLPLYANDELMQQIRSTHSSFHQEAVQVVKLAVDGQKEQALKELEAGTYSRLSLDISTMLAKFHQQTSQDKPTLT